MCTNKDNFRITFGSDLVCKGILKDKKEGQISNLSYLVIHTKALPKTNSQLFNVF